MEIKEVIENVEPEVVTTNKIDKKGLAVIVAVAVSACSMIAFCVKTFRDKKSAKNETEDVKPEDVVTGEQS